MPFSLSTTSFKPENEMTIKHALLSTAYFPLKVFNKIFQGREGRLRVLLYHDIAPDDEIRFSKHIHWLTTSWHFVTPAEFVAMISGDLPIIGDCVLLTFDDGFKSNRRIAETILNPLDIKALFFVVSEFISIVDPVESRQFVVEHISPSMKLDEAPHHWQNMGWEDLNYLVEHGHSIGAHTSTHARLSQVSPADLNAEIVLGANILEEKLNSRIEHFAYTFGDLKSFSPAALHVARKRFKYIYTGLRGLNSPKIPPWAIRRDGISANDSPSIVGAFLEGAADCMYKKSLIKYESWT